VNGVQTSARPILNEKELNLAIGLIKKNQSLLVDSFKKVKNGEKITTLKLK